MNAIFRGIRPFDYLLAGLMTAAGAFLMYENISLTDEDLPHQLSTTSWAILPVFLLVTLPAFGWITRCGVVIPLAFALAYAVARFAGAWRNHVTGLAGLVVLQVVMLVRDASIDTVAGGLAIALPGIALFYGIGVLVQNRVTKQSARVAVVNERAAA
ncbi:hypothetical protein EV646_10762 [Kribbella antiqua]|uniref:Uncharacterized protein n=1 Tax=Kribbella antiqua TaxID=2512217 RepID=A0A4R2ILK1_9ACTN|nr:hypothetical protein [Kribbella antiqua]TCO46041.1 hypothetical protein EV646_10762 [Kribbella antiqua]